jgi:ankyrin repeat protein
MRSPPEPWLCRTALQDAAYGGQTAVIKSQIAAGVEVDETDECGKTALMFAAVNGHLAAVQQLLKAGADVNHASRIDVSTALLYAAKRGHTEVVDALLAAGASPNAMSRDGQFPLTVACAEGHVEIVEKLIATGADINQPAQNGDFDECAGFTPLIYATQVGSEGPLHSEGTDIMQLLLAAGADVDGVDASDYTALMYACKWGSLTVIDLLLTAGADMRHTSNCGGTALHSVANTLSGDTPEHVATVVSIVIAEGVDIDAVGTFGCTALATAMRSGNAVIASTILSAVATVKLGADSPLYIAA